MANSSDLSIYQGDDWSASVAVTYQDGSIADLTGYTAQAQIRTATADQQPQVTVEMQTAIELPNTVTLYIPHDQTTLLTGAVYYWDLQLTSSTNQIVTILAGKVKVTYEITREPGMRARLVRRSA